MMHVATLQLTSKNQSEWLCHLKPLNKGTNSAYQVEAALFQDLLCSGVTPLGAGNHQGGQTSYAPPPCLSIHPPAPTRHADFSLEKVALGVVGRGRGLQ